MSRRVSVTWVRDASKSDPMGMGRGGPGGGGGAGQPRPAEARRLARESVASRVRASEVEPPASVPAALATSCRELATRYGLSLRLTDDGHAVHHGERELAAGAWSQAQAWWCAAQLLRPVLEEEHA